MTFKDFWSRYHREDPDEALENPHKLRIHLVNGKSYDVMFPGSLLATPSRLLVGVGPKAREGMARTRRFCNWDEIEKIEKISERQRAKGRQK